MSAVRTMLAGAALVVVTAVVTTQVVSQTQAPPAVPSGHYANPVPQHEILDRLAGRWEQQVQVWSSPEARPEASRLSANYRWILGGRFLVGELDGFIDGEAFTARELLGYDAFRGEFTQVWIDNRTTAFTVARGQYREADKSIVLDGTEDDVDRNLRDQPFRISYRFASDGEVVIKLERPDKSGTLYRRAEVRATRAE